VRLDRAMPHRSGNRAKRRLWSTGAAAAAAVVLAPGTAAADVPRCFDDYTGAEVRCIIATEATDGTTAGASPAAASSGEWPPPGWKVVSYPAFGVAADGMVCRRQVTLAVPPGAQDPSASMAAWYWMEVEELAPELRPQGDCPPGEAPEVDAGEAREAMLTILTQQLPRAEPFIAPGFGLAGLTAYLETARGLWLNPQPVQVELSTGPVNAAFQATATYVVDWGDGTVTGPHADPGTSWPNGTITHTYLDRGTYEVRVVDQWAVTFTVDGLPPQTVALELDADAYEFEVRERTAVRVLTP
jgi:hypothetical protein